MNQQDNIFTCQKAVDDIVEKQKKYEADFQVYLDNNAKYNKYLNRLANLNAHINAGGDDYYTKYMAYVIDFKTWQIPTEHCVSLAEGRRDDYCQSDIRAKLNSWGAPDPPLYFPMHIEWVDSNEPATDTRMARYANYTLPTESTPGTVGGCAGLLFQQKKCILAPNVAELYADRKLKFHHTPVSDVDGGYNWAVHGAPVPPAVPIANNILCCGIVFKDMTADNIDINTVTQNCTQTVTDNRQKTDNGSGFLSPSITSGSSGNNMIIIIIILVICCSSCIGILLYVMSQSKSIIKV